MRQTDKILSIRLSPGGLSFRTADGAETPLDHDKDLPPAENLRRGLAYVRKKAGKKITRIHIYPDTLKTVLIPAELFDPGMMREYFEINGIAPEADDRLLVSDLDNGSEKIKVITAVEGLWIDLVDEVFEGLADFRSPFVLNWYPYDTKGFTAIYLTPQNAYITVYGSGSPMLFCEALPYSTPADVLYYMTDLAARFDIVKNTILIKGYQCKETQRVLRKIFKKRRPFKSGRLDMKIIIY